MTYNLNGKIIQISELELDYLMKNLQISRQDAISLWLDDNGYTTNEEQEELDEKASKVHINKDIDTKKSKKSRKKPEKKVSDEKKMLFSEILSDLEDVFKENVTVLNENKLISVKIDEKIFKIDIIEQRPPK